tara:strand:+ start:5639 stop:6835 length:1197 start_codon:yes stop_codon:yes gene_type:complete
MKKFDVLLTYSWVRSSYAALRSLNRLGLKVAVADTSRVGMGQWSRLSHFAGRYSCPMTKPKLFTEDVEQLLCKTGANFLLPGHDETEVLAAHRELIPKNIILPIASANKIAKANDKAIMAEHADRLGIPVPKVIIWNKLENLEEILDLGNAPFVVKLRRGNGSKGVFYPETNNEVANLCAKLSKEYSLKIDRLPIVQEKVNGDGWGVSCLYWHGERIASFTHQRLREKISTGGTSTLRVSRKNPILEEYAHELLTDMKWHGLAMIEFKYNSKTNKGWFIEVNPRLWGSIHLAIESGVDFPGLLYTSAIYGPEAARKMVKEQCEGIIARWYLGDVIVAASEFAHLRPANALKLLMPGGADTYDDWFWDDPSAFIGELASYLKTFAKHRSTNPAEDGMLG